MSDLELLVITPCTNPNGGTLPIYRDQLARAGIPHHIEHIELPVDPTVAASVGGYLKLSEQFAHYKRIVITDAFDVTFFGTREDVIEKIDAIPAGQVLLAAEKNCFPEPLLYIPILRIQPDRKDFRYANGGMIAGRPQEMHAWAERVQQNRFYSRWMTNQGLFNLLMVEFPELINIDYKTELFFCLQLGYSELEFERGRPVNTTWGTRPSFLHANGAAPTADMWAKYNRSFPW